MGGSVVLKVAEVDGNCAAEDTVGNMYCCCNTYRETKSLIISDLPELCATSLSKNIV